MGMFQAMGWLCAQAPMSDYEYVQGLVFHEYIQAVIHQEYNQTTTHHEYIQAVDTFPSLELNTHE